MTERKKNKRQSHGRCRRRHRQRTRTSCSCVGKRAQKCDDDDDDDDDDGEKSAGAYGDEGDGTEVSRNEIINYSERKIIPTTADDARPSQDVVLYLLLYVLFILIYYTLPLKRERR